MSGSSLSDVETITSLRPAPMETTTGDSLDHGFCTDCYPVGGDYIVSLCGKLRGDEPLNTEVTDPCAVCYSEGITCRSCGVIFN